MTVGLEGIYEQISGKIMLLLIISFFAHAHCIKLLSLRVPSHAAVHSSVRLECAYDLEGESLYSVKWYKDGEEFFRYQPRTEPPLISFPLEGVYVDETNSTAMTALLTNVDLNTTGHYRCEVSGEAPEFVMVTGHGDMLVVAVPENGPVITGGKGRYQIGETVNMSCSIEGAMPPATLSWFVNGEPADPKWLEGPDHKEDEETKLITTTLRLSFKAFGRHFRIGDNMKLKCLATIGTLYSRSNEESVEGDRMQKQPVLESRNAVAVGTTESRADRVQASSKSSSSGHYSRSSWRLLISASLLSYVLHVPTLGTSR